jgi:DNA-directed RNA polymerase subunit M/transcription elongation factor TFIIS
MRNNKGKRHKATTQDKHDIVDIATDITQAQATNNRFVCKECEPEQPLFRYPQAQLYNPHAGPSYICSLCNKIYDSSLPRTSMISMTQNPMKRSN